MEGTQGLEMGGCKCLRDDHESQRVMCLMLIGSQYIARNAHIVPEREYMWEGRGAIVSEYH